MTVDNILERRAYIKSLLDKGADFNIKDLAKEWNSSYSAILTDIRFCNGQDDYYRKKEPTSAQNIRARKLGIDDELSQKQWEGLLKKFNYACVNCGSTKHICIDHIIPLSRGGSNTINNVQPLCRSCNSRKSNATPDRPATRGGRPRKV